MLIIDIATSFIEQTSNPFKPFDSQCAEMCREFVVMMKKIYHLDEEESTIFWYDHIIELSAYFEEHSADFNVETFTQEEYFESEEY